MFKKASISIVLIGMAILSTGCDSVSSGPPEIIGTDKTYVPGPKIVHQEPTHITPTYPTQARGKAAWYPPKSREKKWKAIVIHHSATTTGNEAVFDDFHKTEHGWKGIGYDFVIGNGKGSRNGQVEVTFRWEQQIPGAHCGGTPNNWANVDAIGICLVGDFSKTSPTWSQMNSLAELVKFLQDRYHIPANKVYGHGDTPGYTGGTKCPGKNFSMW